MVECWILGAFFVAANAVGWWSIRHDKKAARARGGAIASRASPRRRIPERWLWGLAFFGGFLAMMVAMGYYRHKTRKLLFQIPFFVTAFVSTVVWAGWFSVLGCYPFAALVT